MQKGTAAILGALVLLSLSAAMIIVAGPILVKFLMGGFGLPTFKP